MDTWARKPVVLAILDGWGFSKKKVGNPLATANKPNIDGITLRYPATLLQASGLAVGMTWGEAGNSEVGHLNMGAGRIVEQYFSRINRSIDDGGFFSNVALSGAFEHAKNNNSKVHIIGLLTSGTVHAGFSHLVGLANLAAEKKYAETYFHLFLDGKDSGLQEAPDFIEKLRAEIQKRGYGKISTLIGRNFAMDRDNNWDFTRKTYELLTRAAGEKSSDILATIKKYYKEGENDSVMPPMVDEASGFSGITDNDALIFFNFREDSMRQIVRTFIEPDFSQFPKADLKNLYVSTMTRYLESPAALVAFPPPEIVNGFAQVLETNGRHQFHIAETEKYAHVTFFFNGLTNKKYGGEEDIFIESIRDHQSNPAMKSWEIAEKVVEKIKKGSVDFVVLNFANADVLAHTGNFEATVRSAEAVDTALGLIVDAVLKKDGVLVITADHGNAEALTYKGSGERETRHDENPVPFYLVAKQYQAEETEQKIAQEMSDVSGILADVAPTILEVMGIPQPAEMTGKSLLPVLGLK